MPTGAPLVGVLHAGGVLNDATIPKQTMGGVRAVFAAKTVGAGAILQAGCRQPLRAVKLFSSIAAAMGSGGQANYAAANAVMDAWSHSCQAQVCCPPNLLSLYVYNALASAMMLACFDRWCIHAAIRHCIWKSDEVCPGWNATFCIAICLTSSSHVQGVSAESVNWGAWAGHGMAARSGLQRMERLGFGAIPPLAGMLALSSLLAAVGRNTAAPQLLGSVFFWDR